MPHLPSHYLAILYLEVLWQFIYLNGSQPGEVQNKYQEKLLGQEGS